MSIRARLSKQKGAFRLDVDFVIPGVGVSALFGPSGCGKSTLLRCIAGLDTPEATSEIEVDGSTWLNDSQCLPVYQRRVGYVSQAPSLFPHLSVRGNLEFAVKRSGSHADQASIAEISQLLGIEGMLKRMPDSLSGGEKQRVAIARALLSSPRLLLMDEPLAALDMQSKAEILPFIERLCRNASIPVIYVSHAPDEVARLADYLLLMKEGRLLEHGELSEVLSRVDSPLARSSDAFSVLRCDLQRLEGPSLLSVLNVSGSDLALYVPRSELGSDSRLRVRVNARDVSVCLEQPNETSILNLLPVSLKAMSEIDEKGQRLLVLAIAGTSETLLSRVSAYSVEKLSLTPGLAMFAQVKSVALL